MKKVLYAGVVAGLCFLFAGSIWADSTNVDATSEGWQLRFSDTFTRSELGPDWYVASGNWRIKNGVLVGGGVEGDNCIVCTKKMQGAQRLEFYTRSDHPGETAGLLGVGVESSYADGYFFGFGSDGNIGGKLLIEGGPIIDYDAKIIPGKRHHVVCERIGNQLRHIVDGKVTMTFVDEFFVEGSAHVGFSIWNLNTTEIDNVKIYTRAKKE